MKEIVSLLTKLGNHINLNLPINRFDINSSTSIHTLNSDNGLKLVEKYLYIFYNSLNNLFPNSNLDKSLEIRKFKCQKIDTFWEKLYAKSSPSKKLSDLFWMSLPWDKIKENLDHINILDVGTGTGHYSWRLNDFSNNIIDSYLGIDIKENKNWKDLRKRYNFVEFKMYDGKDITGQIKNDTNFILTQSALEHIEDDLTFLSNIRNYIKSNKRKFIQIHLFPSQVCFYLYRFHGIRQYTPRNISKIIKLFKPFSKIILYKLGGNYCNYLHYRYITLSKIEKKIDLRDIQTNKYNKLVKLAIKKDMISPQKNPSFYALVILSNFSSNLFS